MIITQNDTPKLYDTLSDDGGVVDLTGYTVTLEFQDIALGTGFSRAATVVSPATAGRVECQLTAGDTAVIGNYRAQWRAVSGGTVRTFPSDDYILFQIAAAVPLTAPTTFTNLTDFHDIVRSIMGDLHPVHQRYKAEALNITLQSVLRLGQVPGYGLTPNRLGVTPVLTEPRALGLLCYHTAKILLRPDVAAKSFRTRPVSESRGEQKHFLFDLENILFDLTNGSGGVFVTFQSFYGWVNATIGLPLWDTMVELKTHAPVGTATIGSDGLQYNP